MKDTILYLHETAGLGGAENSLLNLVDNLDRERFNAVFACPEEGVFPDKLRERGIKVYPVEYPRVRSVFGVFPTACRIYDIAGKEGAKLVHSNSIRSHIYGTMVGKIKRIPVVWHERNLITTEKVDPDRLLAFLPDAIICNSKAIADRFMSGGRLPEKVSVIYNGVNTGIFNPSVGGDVSRQRLGIGPEETVIGMASRLSANKGHETFLKAAKIICSDPRRRDMKIRFLVVGGSVFDQDSGRERYLEEFAKALEISDKVIFTGFADRMNEMYAAMDILVLASDAEGCGRVLFEAMAMAKPVVATDSGGTPEIVVGGKTGILIKPKDPDDMAGAISALIDDKAKRLSMGAEGRKRIEEDFIIRKNVLATEALYNRLLK